MRQPTVPGSEPPVVSVARRATPPRHFILPAADRTGDGDPLLVLSRPARTCSSTHSPAS